MSANQILVAIDVADLGSAVAMARTVALGGAGIKIGLEFFVFHGRSGVEAVMEAAMDANNGQRPKLFLDLNYRSQNT